MREITQRTITTGGAEVNLVDFGGSESPALLFVHGAFGHARVWDFVVAALPPSRRAFAIDLPGHGHSGHRASEAGYAFDLLVEDIHAAVEAAGGPLILAGHSLGSALAMQYAARYGHALTGAAFLDIDPYPPQRQADHLNEAGQAPPRRYDSPDRTVNAASRMAPAAAPEVHRHLGQHAFREEAGEWVQRFDPAFLRSIRTWDNRDILASIPVPSLVLRGAESTVMSPEAYDLMLRQLRRVTGALIPGATHQLHLDQPARVAEAIEVFAAGLAG